MTWLTKFGNWDTQSQYHIRRIDILFSLGSKLTIGQGILSMCPNGQGNGFCPSQSTTIDNWVKIDEFHKYLQFMYYNLTKYED